MLSGLPQPSAGRAELAGFDVVEQSEEFKKRIGYMSRRGDRRVVGRSFGARRLRRVLYAAQRAAL
jgi:hypothetical protein